LQNLKSQPKSKDSSQLILTNRIKGGSKIAKSNFTTKIEGFYSNNIKYIL